MSLEEFEENFEYCISRDPLIQRLYKTVQHLEKEIEELKNKELK